MAPGTCGACARRTPLMAESTSLSTSSGAPVLKRIGTMSISSLIGSAVRSDGARNLRCMREAHTAHGGEHQLVHVVRRAGLEADRHDVDQLTHRQRRPI